MRKYRTNIKSAFWIKVFLGTVLIIFGAFFIRYSTGMIAYAQNKESFTVDNQKMITIDFKNKKTDNAEQTINVDLTENETNNNGTDEYLEVSNKKQEISWNSVLERYIENEYDDENYIIASLDTTDKYPENWINSFNNRIIILQNIFQTGKYWNHMGQDATDPSETNNIFSVTDIPCNHYLYGEQYCNAHYGKSDEVYPYDATCSQCRGFASLLSDIIFGKDAPVRYFEDYDELRIGDQARIDGDYHTVFIIDKTDEYVIVAECNSDLQTCQISWGRKILRENMAGWYISRWSD